QGVAAKMADNSVAGMANRPSYCIPRLLLVLDHFCRLRMCVSFCYPPKVWEQSGDALVSISCIRGSSDQRTGLIRACRAERKTLCRVRAMYRCSPLGYGFA